MEYLVRTGHLWEEYHLNVRTMSDTLHYLSLRQLCNVKFPHSLMGKQAKRSEMTCLRSLNQKVER